MMTRRLSMAIGAMACLVLTSTEIAAQTAASATPMRSSLSMTCYRSGGWRVTEPHTVPWHQHSE